MKGKFKNKNPNKITLFTNNPNVFIPRKSNKHYCSYLSKSKINEFSYKTNQQLLKISRSDRSIKRNTVSIINQR